MYTLQMPGVATSFSRTDKNILGSRAVEDYFSELKPRITFINCREVHQIHARNDRNAQLQLFWVGLGPEMYPSISFESTLNTWSTFEGMILLSWFEVSQHIFQ